MKISKRILLSILFCWLSSAVFPAFAQQKTDTVCTLCCGGACSICPIMATTSSLPASQHALNETEGQLAAEQQNIIMTDIKSESIIPTDYHLSLRANLLRWATLTPDLGVEWRISPSWGISVNGSWTSWSWNDMNRKYALWEVTPELRYYMGRKKHGYLGALFKTGQFNYKFSAVGKQGDLICGGMVGGYMLKLNSALSLDLSVGVGCTHADYEKYVVIDKVRVHRGSDGKNYWGVSHLGVSLVWNIF